MFNGSLKLKFVCPEKFQILPNLFLQQAFHLFSDFRYAAATPEQLWIALENVLYDNEFDLGDNLTVTQFMRSWTEQTGYPLVTITKENNTFEITQVNNIFILYLILAIQKCIV